MIEHRSFGVVPVRRWKQSWEFFVVQHKTGHWAFPKGHQESGETGEQTARRELQEETGISAVELLSKPEFSEDYTWTRDGVENHKLAIYFLGLVEDHTIVIQTQELSDGRWIPADETEQVLTFPESRAIFRRALKVLKKQQPWS